MPVLEKIALLAVLLLLVLLLLLQPESSADLRVDPCGMLLVERPLSWALALASYAALQALLAVKDLVMSAAEAEPAGDAPSRGWELCSLLHDAALRSADAAVHHRGCKTDQRPGAVEWPVAGPEYRQTLPGLGQGGLHLSDEAAAPGC